MFLFFNKVYVSYGYLSVTSDNCLHSALMHELGHRKQFKTMFAIIMISMAIFIQLFLFSKIAILFFLPVGYLFFCWISRLGEYHADHYALRHTSLDSMREFLIGEGSRLDTRLSKWFYLFRWHPSTVRRYNVLCKLGSLR